MKVEETNFQFGFRVRSSSRRKRGGTFPLKAAGMIGLATGGWVVDWTLFRNLKTKQFAFLNGVTFSQFVSTYRWQHDVVRSNHVTNPRDHNILLLGTICLFIYNHTKQIELVYLFADWLQDLWGRLQFGFQYIRQRQHDVVRSIDI